MILEWRELLSSRVYTTFVSLTSPTPAGAIAVLQGDFGLGSGPVFLENLDCLGNEEDLLNCSGSTVGIKTCEHTRDAGVFCSSLFSLLSSHLLPYLFIFYVFTVGIPCNGTIRWVDGVNGSRRVEVCSEGEWEIVCNENFIESHADFVCRSLGYQKIDSESESSTHRLLNSQIKLSFGVKQQKKNFAGSCIRYRIRTCDH